MKIITWIAQIVAALIMLQTLFFKFSASPESVYIFTTLGMEPFGRIGIGIAELIASILIIWPRTAGWGAGMTVGMMFGAILSHITTLGIEVMNDGGHLFILAVITLLCALFVTWQYRKTLPLLHLI